jgi:alpha-glucosidase (family GH31 glycosyl hydrolase)
MKASYGLLLAVVLIPLIFASSAVTVAPYPSWAHSHMVWLPADSNSSSTLSLVAGYEAHNISVGAVDIDSGWSTGYGSFEFVNEKFPDWQTFVDDLHGDSVRVILWMTSMISNTSPNFAEAESLGYFIRDGAGAQMTTFDWWHGTGGLLDYTQPAARTWWEQQMKGVLGPRGVDGWKCDGTDPYVIELITPRGLNGPLTYREYADWYYGHSLNFSRTLNPEAIIWSRPVDSLTVLEGLNITAFLAYSPKNLVFSGWVGDQNPDFGGLRSAAINILESAWQNYTNFGSDTGGYRASSATHLRTREVFLRWSQLNAFLPLFENGGNDDHTPWAFDGSGETNITDAYRRLVAAHYALGPYFLSTGTDAWSRGISSIDPSSSPPADFPFIIEPSSVADWSYALGPNIFISPVLFEGVENIAVHLPNVLQSAELAARWGLGVGQQGSGWVDFWNSSKTFVDGETVNYATPTNGSGDALVHPVFLRAGALIPLHISTQLPLLPYASQRWAPALTLYIAAVNGHSAGCKDSMVELDVHDAAGIGEAGMRASAHTELTLNTSTGLCEMKRMTIMWSAYHRPLIIVVKVAANSTPKERGGGVVQLNAQALRHIIPKLPDATPSAALAWDSTAPGGGRYPLKNNLSEQLQHAFEFELAGTFYSVDNHMIVFIGGDSAAEKGTVVLEL